MKRSNYKNRHREEGESSIGESVHHLGKRMTEKTHTPHPQYNRKSKHKQNWTIDE